jgi:hypothetical protein
MALNGAMERGVLVREGGERAVVVAIVVAVGFAGTQYIPRASSERVFD